MARQRRRDHTSREINGGKQGEKTDKKEGNDAKQGEQEKATMPSSLSWGLAIFIVALTLAGSMTRNSSDIDLQVARVDFSHELVSIVRAAWLWTSVLVNCAFRVAGVAADVLCATFFLFKPNLCVCVTLRFAACT